MTDIDHDQENADFTILEESLEGLHTNLTFVERRQVNNEVCTYSHVHIMLSFIKYACVRNFFQEKIQYVDSKVAVLSARVNEFEKSCITADEMQKQVHEMREDFDRLKTRVEKLNQSVKCEMVGVLLACHPIAQDSLQAKSLKDMQGSLDELDETVTTFRQEINSNMSRKSGRCSLYPLITCGDSTYGTALLKEHFQLGEKNISDNVAWKATYEGRVNALELEISRVKGKQAHFSNALRNDVTKLQKTMEELQLECTPDHSNFTEGLKGMELLFSSLQDKVEELGTEIAGTQMVAPSLQDELYVGDLSFHFFTIHDPLHRELWRRQKQQSCQSHKASS